MVYIRDVPTSSNFQMLTNFFGVEFLRSVQSKERENENRCLNFTFNIKRETRKFYVKNVHAAKEMYTNSVMHVQSCCFAYPCCFFAVLVAFPIDVAQAP